jgi:predicted Zn-dependent protease
MKQSALLLLSLVFLLLCCTTVPITGRQQLSLVSSGTLNSMSLQSYREFLSQHKVIRGTGEADHLGLIFMAMAGYDPNSAIAFMERLKASDKTASPPPFLSTHPADATRINAMKQVIPEALQYYRKPQ